VVVGREGGGSPAVGIEPRVEDLLERAEVPALVVARGPGAGEVSLPSGVGDDGVARAVDAFHLQMEEKTGLAEGRGAVALAVEEDLRADDVGTSCEGRGEVEGVGLEPARVAGRGAPLDAAAVYFQQIAAVGGDPAGGTDAGGRKIERAAEEDEGVLEAAAGGVPDPARGGEIGEAVGGERRRFQEGLGREDTASCGLQRGVGGEGAADGPCAAGGS